MKYTTNVQKKSLMSFLLYVITLGDNNHLSIYLYSHHASPIALLLTCLSSCSAAGGGGGPDSEATDFGAEKAKLGAGVTLVVEREVAGAAKELDKA